MNKLPEEIDNLIKDTYPNDYTDIIEGYNNQRNTTFRVNTLIKDNHAVEELSSLGISYTKSNLYEYAYLTDQDLSKTKVFENGLIYQQSLSSMLPVIIMNPNPKDTILDMTAAPGSKTSLICQMTNNLASVMAIEIDKIRCDRLKYNLNKLGCKNVVVNCLNALNLDEFFSFDKILLDAPCSGTGTLLSYDASFTKISKKLIDNSSVLQKKLIMKALKILKKGGTLIYSTCSIMPKENEEVVKLVLDKGLAKLEPIENIWNLPTLPNRLDGSLTIKPTNDYEGFYVAKLIKL